MNPNTNLHSSDDEEEESFVPKMTFKEISRGYFRKGRSMLSLGGISVSLFFFSKSLQYDPYNRLYWYNKGYWTYRYGKSDEARVLIQNSLKLDPEYDCAFLCLGHVNSSQNKYKDALKYYEKSRKLSPKDVDIVSSIAMCKFNLYEMEEAIRELEFAKSINSKNDDPYYRLGLIYHGSYRYKEAIESFKEGLGLVKSTAFRSGFHSRMSMSYSGAKMFTEAREHVAKGLKIKTTDSFPVALLAQSFLHFKEKKFKQSLEDVNEATKYQLNKWDVSYLVMKSKVLRKMNRLEESLECLQKAELLHMENEGVSSDMGLIYIKMEKWKEAEMALNKSIGLTEGKSFQNFKTYRRRAKYYYLQEKYNLALNDIKKSMKLMPNKTGSKELRSMIMEKIQATE